jgi:hypothetical protein
MTDIHIQHPDSCASDRCLTAEDSTAPVKMLVPSIQTRVKQASHRTGRGVHTCNIGALVVIAVKAGKSEIFGGCRPAVLFRNDVVHLVPGVGEHLWHLAVFTTDSGTFQDQLPQSAIHYSTELCCRDRRVFDFTRPKKLLTR